MAPVNVRLVSHILILLSFLVSIAYSQSPSATPAPSLSLSLTTTTSSYVTTSRSRNNNVPLSTFTTSVYNVTYTITPSSTASASASATPTPDPITLHTVIDPAFGVLGGLLILTGIPMSFLGHRNRWTSFFLSGAYTLSLVCLVLIVKYGVLPAIHPPSQTIRGMFLLACAVAGIAGGGIAVFFWKGARFFIGAWGGFAVALWIQCFRNGGLIRPIGLRWILYIGCAVVGFVLCTIPKIHYHILLVSTAFVGASALILGVDCFTTAGLKEFYMWNIGFTSLFPKFTNNGIQFPVNQTIQIELGLLGAVSLMGVAVQLRVLKILNRKLAEIRDEQKKRDAEADLEHSQRFTAIHQERDQWEKDHPTLVGHGRAASGLSSVPLMKDQEGSESPTLLSERQRHHSGVSSLLGRSSPDDEMVRAYRNPVQTPGALPALELGQGIEDDVPSGYILKDNGSPKSEAQLQKDKEKQNLLLDIENLRKSIDLLQGETPVSSTASASRHLSQSSKRTLSFDALTNPAPAHLRPPRDLPPRARVNSAEITTLSNLQSNTQSLSRPKSVPLPDDWDVYLHDRRLIQPPSGVSPPIVTTPTSAATRMPMSPAVAEALANRKKLEAAFYDGEGNGSRGTDADDTPLGQLAAPRPRHKSTRSLGSNIPLNILPPRKTEPTTTSNQHQRSNTRTFEELNDRHRERLRELQAPLTQQEKESADLVAAKQRWERSKALEKEAVTRRQNEKAAMLEKEKKKRLHEEVHHKGNRSSTLMEQLEQSGRHSRALSADKLTNMNTSNSKRLSTLKVEDWQKYQQEVGEHGKKSRRPS